MRKIGKFLINLLKLLFWLVLVEYKISNFEIHYYFSHVAIVLWSTFSVIIFIWRSKNRDKKVLIDRRFVKFKILIRFIKFLIEFIL